MTGQTTNRNRLFAPLTTAFGRRNACKASRRRQWQQSGPIEALESRELLSGQPVAPQLEIGTNVEAVFDWSAAWTFTDAFKHSRDWIPHEINTETGGFIWDSGAAVQTNNRGWVTALDSYPNAAGELIRQAVGTLMFRDIGGHYPAGTYRAEWDGNGGIATSSIEFDGDATVVNHGLTADGRNFADLQVTPTNEGIYLGIHSIDPADPIRNINVWMPDYQGQSFVGQRDWTPSAGFLPFHPAFLERVQPFGTIRFMQMGGTNGSRAVEWTDHRPLDHARQVINDARHDGSSVEYMIALANATQSNAYFNLPHMASDDFVQQFATRVRDQLDPNLRAIFAYSNEGFNNNPADGFVLHQYVTDQLALPENAGMTRGEFLAREHVRDFQVIDQVFANQLHRRVRLVEGWAADPGYLDSILPYVNGLFDAVAVAGYFGGDTEEHLARDAGTTANDIISEGMNSIATTIGLIDVHRELVERYEGEQDRDIDLFLYESGNDFGLTGQSWDQAHIDALQDPRMEFMTNLVLNGANDSGVNLAMDYQLTQSVPALHSSMYGSLHYQDQPIAEAYEYLALTNAINGVSIVAANNRPTVSDIADVLVAPGDSITINFTVSDTETPADSLTILVDGSESSVVPDSAISVSGTGTDRTLTITPVGALWQSSMISVLVADADIGTAVETFQLSIVPQSMIPVPLPAHRARLENGILIINGTTAADPLDVYDAGNGQIEVAIIDNGNWLTQTFAIADITEIHFDAGEGDDGIFVAPSLSISVFADAGPGNDSIITAAGDDTILGGDGDDYIESGTGNDVVVGGNNFDIIYGGGGRDVVIGGNGVDLLFADGGDDILIGGRTSLDNDTASLNAIRAEWTSTGDYLSRVTNLNGSAGTTGANGSTFLRYGDTVFDDGDYNLLTGGSGRDWFFFDPIRDDSDLDPLDELFASPLNPGV